MLPKWTYHNPLKTKLKLELLFSIKRVLQQVLLTDGPTDQLTNQPTD